MNFKELKRICDARLQGNENSALILLILFFKFSWLYWVFVAAYEGSSFWVQALEYRPSSWSMHA